MQAGSHANGIRGRSKRALKPFLPRGETCEKFVPQINRAVTLGNHPSSSASNRVLYFQYSAR
jgi:hypothetical protein